MIVHYNALTKKKRQNIAFLIRENLYIYCKYNLDFFVLSEPFHKNIPTRNKYLLTYTTSANFFCKNTEN